MDAVEKLEVLNGLIKAVVATYVGILGLYGVFLVVLFSKSNTLFTLEGKVVFACAACLMAILTLVTVTMSINRVGKLLTFQY